MVHYLAFDDAHTISVHEYDYDALGRRQTATDKAGSLTLPAQNDAYAYDALDNWTKKTVNGVDQYAVFDAANQLVELRSGSPTGALTHAFVYDANGNLTQKCEGTGVSRTTTTCSGSTVSSFTWNPDDQLIAFYKPGVSESYQYDQAGRRIAKTSNGVTTYYRYNGDDIDAEYSATWSETARYVHGPNTDDPLMRLTGQTNDPSATAIYYHQDGINSVVATSDQAGNIVAAQLFDAWGNRVQSSGTIQTYGYTGREPDATGMIYYRARYYDPTLGRFISRDPAGMPNGVNRYAYVNNNPVNLTDPTGLYAKQYNINSNTANIGYTADLSSFGQTYSSGSYNLGSNQSSAAIGEQNPWAQGGRGVQVAANDIDPYSLPTISTRGVNGKTYNMHPVPGYSPPSDGMSLAVGVLGIIGAPEVKGAQAVAGAAQSVVKEGTTVFRVWGDGAGAMGRSWTTVDPRMISGYRNAAGLPSQNSGRFLSEGILQNTQGVTTRGALPLHGNAGGLPEVIVPNPESQILLRNIQGLNPRF